MRSAWSKLVIVLCALATLAWAAPPQFSAQKRVGLTTGDQWEPSVAADGSGRIYVLYPHYGQVPDCKDCRVPTMLLVASGDNGKTWQTPRVMLETGSGQFDAQIAVDPADRRTLYAAWLQNEKRAVMLAKSVDSGATWAFTIAVRSEVELDKPALAVRGQSVYVAFNHEEEVWVAASQDGGRSFTPTRVNAESRPGWSLLGAATVDPCWQCVSGMGFLLQSRRSARLGEPLCSEVSGCWQDVEPNSARCFRGGARLQRRRLWRGLSGRASRPDVRRRRNSLRALERGQRALGPQRIYFSSSTNGGENWLPRAVFLTPDRAWNMLSQHSWRETPATSASHGWTRAVLLATLRIGTPTIEVQATAARPGEKRFESQATCRTIAISGQDGFRFPFGDYFGLAIDNHGDTHVVWGEGLNYQSPGSIWHASGR